MHEEKLKHFFEMLFTTSTAKTDIVKLHKSSY